MISHPQFKSHLHAETVAGEGVVLLRETSTSVLRGQVYELLAPLVDGHRSADEICEQLDGQLSPAEVYYALHQLEKKGLVDQGNGAQAVPHRAFWHAQGMSPVTAARRLEQTAVLVTGLAGVEVEPLVEALQFMNVRVSRETNSLDQLPTVELNHSAHQLRVVATDDYLRNGLELFNHESLGTGRPWMLVKPLGSQIWVGPLIIPGKTGCWECLAQRLRINREAEVYLYEKLRRRDPVPIPLVDTRATQTIAWNIAAVEIAKWVASQDASDSPSPLDDDPGLSKPNHQPNLECKLLTLDVFSWSTQWHTLVRRPQCPACGHEDRDRDSTVFLQSRAKTFTRDNGHRAVTPEQTLQRYGHHVSPITGAVTLLKPVCRSQSSLINVYIAGHNFARRRGSVEEIRTGLRSQSSGKGMSELQAKVSGLCEGLERYSGVFRGDEQRTPPCQMRDLGEVALHPNACMLYSQKQYGDRDAINERQSAFNSVPEPFDVGQAVEWTPVWSLTRNEVRYLPTAFCYYGFPQEPYSCCACSNGNAAGNTLEEAILQGFFELIERDAVALWWYNRVRRPGVNLDSFDEPYMRQLAAFLRDQQHRDLWLLDLTTDFQLPIFAALSRRADRQPEEILFGFGAHFDARIAALRAVTELNQMLAWVLTDKQGTAPERDEVLDDPETVAWLRNATLDNQPYLVPDDVPLRSYSDYSDMGTDDLRDDVLASQALVKRQGLEMLVLDQTRPDIGLHVVKVIVPGLRHFWARFAPGRLYEVPVQLGWLSQPLREDQLNPISMFM